MQTLQVSNAQVTISGDNGYDFGTEKLIMNVVFQYDQEPAEQDTPSGAWWVWPMRQGVVQVQGFLPPGRVPPNAPSTLDRYTMEIKATDVGGTLRTINIPNCYRAKFTAAIKQLGEAVAAIELQVVYQVFLDDNGVYTDWTPPA